MAEPPRSPSPPAEGGEAVAAAKVLPVQPLTAQTQAAKVFAGDVRTIARLLSRLEDGDATALEVVRALGPAHGPTARGTASGESQGTGSQGTGSQGIGARVIGVTGPPGSGKSTLVDRLIGEFRGRGLRVGVLAVDPSSPFTGGAILGDRLRMQAHATDPDVFIRSLASRGHLGGLSAATRSAARVLAAAGHDIVIIETVGVGQSEVEVVRVAETVVLVSVPGLGDDIQAIKAGVMEIGDIFVVNKADREGADRVVREIRGMLETAAGLAWGRLQAAPDTLAHHGAVSLSPGTTSLAAAFDLDGTGHPVLPPVIKTVAETGEGCAELADLVLAHRGELERTGRLPERRLAAARSELRDLVVLRVGEALARGDGPAREEALARRVAAGETDSHEAADRLFEAMVKGGSA
jgi:LAO/AO transport system kinase